MTGKRFTYLDASRNKYIGSFFCNGVPLTNDEVVDLLNENEQLKKKLEENKEEDYIRTKSYDPNNRNPIKALVEAYELCYPFGEIKLCEPLCFQEDDTK